MAGLRKGFSPWLVLLAVLLAAFLGSILPWPSPTAEAKPAALTFKEFSVTLTAPDIIAPNTFTVNVGDTIRFWIYNEGPAPHNLHISGQGVEVESPLYVAREGGVWEYTFTRAGVYALYCSVLGRRPGIDPTHRVVGPMEGVVVVTDPGVTADLSRYQTRTVGIKPVGGSGVLGTAFLQPKADGTIAIRVEARGLTPGSSYLSGIYDRRSVNCRGGLMGSFAAPVQAVAATARILYTTSGPIDNFFAISIREGTAAPGTVIACSDIAGLPAAVPPPAAAPAAPAPAPAAPAALPRTGEDSFLGTFLGITALGGLALVLGLVLRRREKRV